MLRIFCIIAIFTSLIIIKPLQAKDTAVNALLPIVCELSPKALDFIKHFDEVPIFIGKDVADGAERMFSLFYNKKSETFTALLSVENNSYLCIIASGRNGNVFLPKSSNLN